jgi:hypothetical protein
VKFQHWKLGDVIKGEHQLLIFRSQNKKFVLLDVCYKGNLCAGGVSSPVLYIIVGKVNILCWL